MADNQNLINWLTGQLEKWGATYLRVRQDGAVRTLPLTEIKDQRIVANYLKAQIREYEDTLPAKEKKQKPAAGEAAVA